MGQTTEHIVEVEAFIVEDDNVFLTSVAKCSCGWEYEEKEIHILSMAILNHKINVIGSRVGLSFERNKQT